ncbi:FAD-dependent monooxygenase [Streptomyces sp. NPDC089799]|uniref:FAD-dependent monooxygenase n=1 Tax=Streptomyces sp. NPDC089799 TaxID=3155066 RepID=UPI003427047C
MAQRSATDVLVVGAGPVGLTAAVELRRRGVSCRIVDRLVERLPFAKAVGIQPRTLEIWDRMGMVREALEASVPLRGQLLYVNGAAEGRFDLVLPPEVPYGFAALPQFETERILTGVLERSGGSIERGTELVSFAQDSGGVTCRLVSAAGVEEELRVGYLVGCDGAHSAVRKGLGLSFEGGAFPEEYMLGDVEVDWDLPEGYTVRSSHLGPDGAVDDVLVCIPLPGRKRYRMSMTVPSELSVARRGGTGAGADAGDGVAHGLEGGVAPALADIQAVLDRLAPQPTTASALRWSSVFRISHRIVDRYGTGRVFVAGDAAHIHPPTGAQGMNTGIQDAWNLAWKLALAVEGAAAPGLLASYDAERRPVGEEVVGRTVRHATEGMEADMRDPAAMLLREAQLLVGYRGSPVVGPDEGPDAGPDAGAAAGPVGGPVGSGAYGDGPRPGDRAPDCGGLTSRIAAYPMRLYDVLRGRGHVLVLYDGGGGVDGGRADELAEAARKLSGGRVEAFVVSGAGGGDGGLAGGTLLPVYRDARGEFARLYGVAAGRVTAFVVRPDGYVGARVSRPGVAELREYFAGVLG